MVQQRLYVHGWNRQDQRGLDLKNFPETINQRPVRASDKVQRSQRHFSEESKPREEFNASEKEHDQIQLHSRIGRQVSGHFGLEQV